MLDAVILPLPPASPAEFPGVASPATRQEVLGLYGVAPSGYFDAQAACERRVEYLKRLLRATGRKGYVLGISGGVDSSTAGRLAQLACQQLRAEGLDARFHAVRLPAGVQRDEGDARLALDFIEPDEVMTVNIGPSADALNAQCVAAMEASGRALSAEQVDYHKGNIKARLRMTAQYHLAAATGCLVLGTDHASEAVMGFFTKGGDGQADALVLNGLNKRQVRACARFLGAPQAVWGKPPTADLEELNPGKIDDEGFGLPYEALDDFLEGKAVEPEVAGKILATYAATRHKRDPAPAFKG